MKKTKRCLGTKKESSKNDIRNEQERRREKRRN